MVDLGNICTEEMLNILVYMAVEMVHFSGFQENTNYYRMKAVFETSLSDHEHNVPYYSAAKKTVFAYRETGVRDL